MSLATDGFSAMISAFPIMIVVKTYTYATIEQLSCKLADSGSNEDECQNSSLFADTERAENEVKNVLGCRFTDDLAYRIYGNPKFHSDDFQRLSGRES